MANIEKGATLILEKATKNIFSRNLNDNVCDAMKEMKVKKYSYIPIYDLNNQLVGVFSTNNLFQYISNNKSILINENTIFEDIFDCINIQNFMEDVLFVPANTFYSEVIDHFINMVDLSCVLVTMHGQINEKVMGIITVWDIIQNDCKRKKP